MNNQIKISPDTAKALIYLGIGVVVIIIIATFAKKVFGGLDGLLSALGLKTDPEAEQAKDDIKATEREATANPQSSPWSPALYKSAPPGTKLVTTDTADKAAKMIYNSSGYLLPDRPEQAFAAIKLMPTQAAVSFLTERFERLYKKDLLSWLTEAFNDTPTQIKTFSQITVYVKNLKKY